MCVRVCLSIVHTLLPIVFEYKQIENRICHTVQGAFTIIGNDHRHHYHRDTSRRRMLLPAAMLVARSMSNRKAVFSTCVQRKAHMPLATSLLLALAFCARYCLAVSKELPTSHTFLYGIGSRRQICV